MTGVLPFADVLAGAGLRSAGRRRGARLAREPRPGPPSPAQVSGGLVMLAACLRSGAPPQAALLSVAEVAAEPLASLFRRTAALARLGFPAAVAYRGWGSGPGLPDAASVMIRTELTGAATGDALLRIARRMEQEHLARAREGVRRAGVTAIAPLCLCFLPAFLLVGVVPVAISLLSQLRPG